MTESRRGLQLLSTLQDDGTIVAELAEEEVRPPRGHEVLIRVEAAPINPSDLMLLFGPADLAHAVYDEGKVVAPLPDAALRAMAGRVGQPMPVGNEGAGTDRQRSRHMTRCPSRHTVRTTGTLWSTMTRTRSARLPTAISPRSVKPAASAGVFDTMRTAS